MPISGGLSGIWDYAKGMFGNEPQQVPNQPGTEQIPQDTQSIQALFGGDPNTANKQAASPVGIAKEDLEKQGMVANKDGNFYPSGSSSSSEMMYKLDPESGQYVLAPNYKSSGGLMDFTPMPGAGAQFAGQIGKTAATVGMALRPDNPLNAILNAAGGMDGSQGSNPQFDTNLTEESYMKPSEQGQSETINWKNVMDDSPTRPTMRNTMPEEIFTGKPTLAPEVKNPVEKSENRWWEKGQQNTGSSYNLLGNSLREVRR